jgi:membrane-associated phospholipid phosphatase
VGPLERIREHGHQCPAALADPSLVTRLFDDNPVAAIPSLHGAWSTLAALILWRWRPRLWPIGVTAAFVQQFAVVYLGEHYVIDILLGDVLAIGAWWLSGRIFLAPCAAAQGRERATSDSIS